MESERETAAFEAQRVANGGKSGQWSKLTFDGLVCGPADLYKYRSEPGYKEPPGVQGALVRAYDDTPTGYAEGAYALAFLCIYIGSLPAILADVAPFRLQYFHHRARVLH